MEKGHIHHEDSLNTLPIFKSGTSGRIVRDQVQVLKALEEVKSNLDNSKDSNKSIKSLGKYH